MCQFPGVDRNEGVDAVEVPVLINDSEEDVHANIAIELFSGPAPRRMKYVWFDLGNGLMIVEEHDTQSGTVYGHANAAGAEAVGAAPWYNTSAFGPQNKPECAPACLELFSSAGGVPILFDKSGRRFPFPLIRIKPGLTGPDGGNTTFFIADIAAPIDRNSELEGLRLRLGLRLRRRSEGAATDCGLLGRIEPHPEPRAHVTTGRGARDKATRGAVRSQNAYGSAAGELVGGLRWIP